MYLTVIYVGKITKEQIGKYPHNIRGKTCCMTVSVQSLETKRRIHAKVLYIKYMSTILSNTGELRPGGHEPW